MRCEGGGGGGVVGHTFTYLRLLLLHFVDRWRSMWRRSRRLTLGYILARSFHELAPVLEEAMPRRHVERRAVPLRFPAVPMGS